MYDIEDESLRASQSRPLSRVSISRAWDRQNLLQKPRSSSRATTRATEKIPYHPLQAHLDAIHQPRGRLTAQEFAASIHPYPFKRGSSLSDVDHHARHRAFSNHHNSRTTKAPIITPEDLSLLGANLEDGAQELDSSHETRSSEDVAQRDIFNRPSRTQLVRDADTFQHYRIRSIARTWFYNAVQASHDRRLLEQKALSHDAERLLRESLEQWQQRLRLRRYATETERFFNRLELRAGRARNLYLLSRAFTHWAECAYEVAINTSTARRHLLRLKFFNAWLEITAVNALKARRLRLQKFFTIWQQRFARVTRDDARAVVLCRDNLHKFGYWCWFWTFCGKRAPEWRAARLKSRYFSKWILALRQASQRNYQVTATFNEKVGRRILKQWLAKARTSISQTREAAQLNYQNLNARLLRKWRLTTYHAPLARQISNMVDWRVAGTTFAIFNSRYRFERQAEEVNRLRLLRNAWTQWNDRLRWQTLSYQVDNRVVVEALYRWVLAERYVLLRRLYEERLKLRHLSKLMHISYNIQAQRNTILRAFNDAKKRRCLHSSVVRWRQQLASYDQDSDVAFHFNAPRIAQENLHKLVFKVSHLKKLDGWAKDAEFYFITSRVLMRWRSKTTDSKRQKRRDAYIRVRRKAKMQLATRYLTDWRRRADRSLSMQDTAQQIYQDRLFQFGTNLFDTWRARLVQYSNWTHQAEDYYSLVLIAHHLYLWRQHFQVQLNSEELARLFFEPHLASLASSCLHKCRLRMIEFKALASKAQSFRRTYDKRHIRRYIRQWHERTAAGRNLRLTPDRMASSSNSGRLVLQAEADTGDKELTTRAEEWTALDLGEWIPALEAQSSSTPLPGYLTTPSKRAARARALVGTSTTPIRTPFGRRLGPQLGTQPRTEVTSGKRVAFGTSTIGAQLGNSDFGAILENESPKTPGRPS